MEHFHNELHLKEKNHPMGFRRGEEWKSKVSLINRIRVKM